MLFLYISLVLIHRLALGRIMRIDLSSILYTLGIGLLGYFLRDIYNFIKKKLIKGDKPRTSLRYSYRHKSTSGTNPRKYTFYSKIKFKNIDTQPLYDVNINLVKAQETILLTSVDSLPPNEEIIIDDKIEVAYGDFGNKPKEAEKTLPVDFKTPNLIVKFQNKNGHKFNNKLDMNNGKCVK